MSPRAACRLERLGHHPVYDYVEGIADWKGAGLPIDGTGASGQTVSDATRPDVPTCQPDEVTGDVAARLSDWDFCVVVDCGRTVVGAVTTDMLANYAHATAGDVMEPGPSTVRADTRLEPLAKRMRRHDAKHVLVTTPEGSLLGAVLLPEATRVLAGEAPSQVWRDCEGCPGLWAPPRSRSSTTPTSDSFY